jgi:type I restriction enzyme S subunit
MSDLPTGWVDESIDALGEIVGGGTPSRAAASFWGGSIPWVTPTDITALTGKHVRDTPEKITNDGLAGSAARLLPHGTIVVTTRATLGEAAIAAVPLTTNQGFKNIIPNQTTDAVFTYYLLKTLRPAMLRLASGTTFPEISKKDFSRIRIQRPIRTEQERIGAGLDTADEAIAKTEAVIAKLRQVRTGLIHDLLTFGLDENGHLRDPIAHPDQFSDSPLGPVPSDWTVAPLRHFLSSAEYGISTSLKSEGALPVLRMNNLSGGEVEVSDVKFATCEVPPSLNLREGDVLFNRTNSYEHVGKTSIWRGQLPLATFASYLVRLNPASEKLTSEFLNMVMNLPEYQLRMRRFATPAVQQVNINPTSLQQMLVAIPGSIAEQERIFAKALESARLLVAETAELTKLQSIKSGLMDDLLTGRIRVPEATP